MRRQEIFDRPATLQRTTSLQHPDVSIKPLSSSKSFHHLENPTAGTVVPELNATNRPPTPVMPTTEGVTTTVTPTAPPSTSPLTADITSAMTNVDEIQRLVQQLDHLK
ncbi:hypothetical protein DERF_014405 [Dermatophagoides farinae]|uniref:Uncharacterized protein n=1 Tax=Dermatophagoides farinae TaxID=6954 RepID=A0A922HLX0_DERFA|nr:hypothetical protein DERF_014405 [Dermatophagoides farinae]